MQQDGNTDSAICSRDSNEADEGHAYFLGVLEKTREVVKPRSPSEDRLAEPIHAMEAEGSEQPEEVHNLFNKLDLQEPSQDFLDAPDVAKAAATEEEVGTL